MNKIKQLIERALPFSGRYIYIELIRGSVESGQCTVCDNCGKLITNMVKVVNKETRKQHYIGTDCAETLSAAKCLYNNGSASDFYLDIYVYNKTARFATELRKGKKYIDNGFVLFVETDKGKQVDCYRADLVKFFPELI